MTFDCCTCVALSSLNQFGHLADNLLSVEITRLYTLGEAKGLVDGTVVADVVNSLIETFVDSFHLFPTVTINCKKEDIIYVEQHIFIRRNFCHSSVFDTCKLDTALTFGAKG